MVYYNLIFLCLKHFNKKRSKDKLAFSSYFSKKTSLENCQKSRFMENWGTILPKGFDSRKFCKEMKASIPF